MAEQCDVTCCKYHIKRMRCGRESIDRRTACTASPPSRRTLQSWTWTAASSYSSRCHQPPAIVNCGWSHRQLQRSERDLATQSSCPLHYVLWMPCSSMKKSLVAAMRGNKKDRHCKLAGQLVSSCPHHILSVGILFRRFLCPILHLLTTWTAWFVPWRLHAGMSPINPNPGCRNQCLAGMGRFSLLE